VPWDYIVEATVGCVLIVGAHWVSSLLGEEWHFLHYLTYAVVILLACCAGAAVIAIEYNHRRPHPKPVEKPRPSSGQGAVVEMIVVLVLMGSGSLYLASLIFEKRSLLACFLILVGLILFGVGAIGLSRWSRQIPP
jgi:drug/metabolite transporter (DMT)-like permease